MSVQPKAREAVCVALRTVLIRPDRDEIAQEILRYGDASGNGWADVIDTLTTYPNVRGKLFGFSLRSVVEERER